MKTLGGDNGNNANNGYADKNFDTHYTTLYALEYVKIREYPHNEETNTNNFLFLLNIDNYGLVAAVGLYTENGNAKWSLGYANGGWGYSVQTNSFMNPALNEWYALELRVTCSLGSAEYQVWLNGVELTDLHITGANSVTSTIDYLEIGDSLFMQDYDNVTVSDQYIVPTIPPTSTSSQIGFIIINGGSGYTTPAVIISGGGGTGATATAYVSHGVIYNMILTNAGSGYTSAPTVTINDPNPRATNAVVIATFNVQPTQPDNGLSVKVTIGGNVTSTQRYSYTITTNPSANTTMISVNLTGESGTSNFSNITIPKSAVLQGTTPTVYIDGQLGQDQGFTQDNNNYYVWYATHFSSRQLSIVFALFTPLPSTSSQPNLTQPKIYAIASAITIALIATVIIILRKSAKGKS
jgi:hypothetical protein